MNKQLCKFTEILGVPVAETNYHALLKQITAWIRSDTKTYICASAVHLIMEANKNAVLLAGLQHSGLVVPDGMPLVWISHFYRRHAAQRIYGPELMLKTCELAERKGFRIFLFGGAHTQSLELKNELQKKFPLLNVVGHIDTPIRPIPHKKNKEFIQKINESRAQIVFVGLGCPTQELWMIKHRKQIEANLLIGVGAAFDFITHRTKQAPFWLQERGLEWLFRLAHEPRRLWYRYTVLNVEFLLLLLRQLLFTHESKIINHHHY